MTANFHPAVLKSARNLCILPFDVEGRNCHPATLGNDKYLLRHESKLNKRLTHDQLVDWLEGHPSFAFQPAVNNEHFSGESLWVIKKETAETWLAVLPGWPPLLAITLRQLALKASKKKKKVNTMVQIS